MPPAPGLWTSRKAWNKLIKAEHGNIGRKKPEKPSNIPSFNVIHQNIPGYKSQKDIGQYIGQIVRRFNPALLFLTEVNPDDVEKVAPPDYTFIRGTLPGEALCRVCLLLKVTQKYEVIEINCDVPTVAVKILGWTFVGVYREWRHGARPETKDRRDLELIRLKTLVRWWRQHLRAGKGLVLGDFNFDPFRHAGHQSSLKHIRALIDEMILDNNWQQLVTETTRSQRGQESSCIDHVYVNKENFVEHLYHENVIGTDHSTVGVKVRLTEPIFESHSFMSRNINKIPEGAFERIFCNSRVHEIYQAQNIHDSVWLLESKIISTLNVVAPEKKVQTRENYAKWITPELEVKIKHRNNLRKKAVKTKMQEHWMTFKECQKGLNKELRKAREDDLRADMDVKNAKLRWKRVKTHAKIGRKGGAQEIELDVEDGRRITEHAEVAERLNNYFKTKVVKLRQDLDVSVDVSLAYTDEYLEGKNVKKFDFKQVSRPYVKNIIKNLTNTGALGRDQISTQVLKKFSHVLTGPITHIVNMAIYHGEYPSAWKLGIITPLPKGGNPHEEKNWRPITINTSMSKILETCVNNQISEHMETSGLYSKTQHAYRKVRSVTTALIELDTIVKRELNRGKYCAIVTTDISAGFNLVSKEILIPKMSKFGFGEMSCKLLENYLTGRRTRVKIQNVKSGEVLLETGVGEGSVLGPNFFSCGMTDVAVVATRITKALEEEDDIKVFITQIEYADDCTGVVSADSEEDLQVAVNKLLKGFSEFYSANGLKMNESKSNLLVFRPHKKKKTLTLAGKDEVENLRLLGLFIDNQLTYEYHTKIVCGRLAGKTQALGKLSNKASFKTHKEVTVSLIHSTIEFCAEIYLRTYKNQKAVQKKLNSAMRMLLNPTEFDASCTQMMVGLEWLNVSNMWRWCQTRTLKRILDTPGQTPYLWELINLNLDCQRFRYTALKTKFRKYTRWARESYLYIASELYNRLGLHGRHFEDYEEMRNQVKSQLISTFGNQNLT